jgi:hypothetical protein
MSARKLIAGALGAAAVAATVALAPSASASVFTMCPSGNAGVVGGHTSCAFAENVQRVFWGSGANRFVAYSPVTGERYVMTCAGLYTAYFNSGAVRTTTHCYGGSNAEVVIW